MRARAASFALFAVLAIGSPAAKAAAACGDGASSLGVERIVEIDAAAGPIYGDITRRTKEPSFLKPKEVVLTFDDGPMPWITKSILDTLDRYCTKGTFFEVGRMAVAYPGMVREVLGRGHTVGGHTWSHPFNLPRMPAAKAQDEIEKGLSAVALAAGQPIAPFFRFTGLSDSDPLLGYLQTRGIASFTVDIVSNDSYIRDAGKLAHETLKRVEEHNGGIILFHDIKAATAKALPVVLAELQKRGYKVVHMRAKQPLKPLPDYDEQLGPAVAKALVAQSGKQQPVPFFNPAALGREPAVVALAPEPRVAPPKAARSTAALSWTPITMGHRLGTLLPTLVREAATAGRLASPPAQSDRTERIRIAPIARLSFLLHDLQNFAKARVITGHQPLEDHHLRGDDLGALARCPFDATRRLSAVRDPTASATSRTA